jgi:signal transduction histidine kinase
MASRAVPAAGAVGTIAGVLALAWTLDSGADADRTLPTRSALLAVAVTACAVLLALALTEIAPLGTRTIAVGGAGIALLGLVAFRLGAGRLEREALRMRSLALLGTLSAELAHEVRNPLAAIRGEVQRLAADIPPDAPPDLASTLRRIDREIDRLDQVVREYGALARGRSVRNEKVDLSAELRELLALHRRAVPRNVELREELPDGLPKLRADADRLRAVVLNLVRNALLAMPEGGTLTVRTRLQDRILVVEVVDTGVGIAPEDRRRVFEPLYSTRERGTGLGLAIARRIAEEHGGAIELDSALGRGSTFRVLLPLDAAPPSGGQSS